VLDVDDLLNWAALIQEKWLAEMQMTHQDPRRPVYVDVHYSKQWGFAPMVYHVNRESPPSVEDMPISEGYEKSNSQTV
jgi:hypothetical protein